MRRTLHIACMLAVALATVPVSAQEWRPCPAADLLHRRQVADSLYRGLWGFQVGVEFRSFRSKDDAAPYERLTATVRREGERFSSELDGVLTVQDGRMRVVADREGRTIMVADPVDMEDPYVQAFSEEAIAAAASCWTRSTEAGIEYRLLFGRNAAIESVWALYDRQGWLRRSETVWRTAIEAAPGEPGPATSVPRIEVDHGLPAAIGKGAYTGATDPGRIVALAPDGPQGRGEWARYEVIDVRLRP